MDQYDAFLEILSENNGTTSMEQRKKIRSEIFSISHHTTTLPIFNYFNEDEVVYKASETVSKTLRYGEKSTSKRILFRKFRRYVLTNCTEKN